MAHLYKSIVRIPRLGLLPEDDSVNVMHFDADGDGLPEHDWAHYAAGLHSRIATFYQAIGGYLSDHTAGTGTITSYDMNDAVPRVPKFDTTFTFVNSSSVLPAEVAICLSFRGAVESGVKMARRRGRIFLGPLGGNAIGPSTNGKDMHVPEAVRQAIVVACGVMADGGSGAAKLAVYSPTTDVTENLEDSFNDVVLCWVDDALDTVRSRGTRATARTELIIPPPG